MSFLEKIGDIINLSKLIKINPILMMSLDGQRKYMIFKRIAIGFISHGTD